MSELLGRRYEEAENDMTKRSSGANGAGQDRVKLGEKREVIQRSRLASASVAVCVTFGKTDAS